MHTLIHRVVTSSCRGRWCLYSPEDLSNVRGSESYNSIIDYNRTMDKRYGFVKTAVFDKFPQVCSPFVQYRSLHALAWRAAGDGFAACVPSCCPMHSTCPRLHSPGTTTAGRTVSSTRARSGAWRSLASPCGTGTHGDGVLTCCVAWCARMVWCGMAWYAPQVEL